MVSGTVFDASAPCTGGDTVIYLWKNAGAPFVVWTTQFKDVNESELNMAVAWAFKGGITSGTSFNTFSPDNTCTRGQIATFPYRAVK